MQTLVRTEAGAALVTSDEAGFRSKRITRDKRDVIQWQEDQTDGRHKSPKGCASDREHENA